MSVRNLRAKPLEVFASELLASNGSVFFIEEIRARPTNKNDKKIKKNLRQKNDVGMANCSTLRKMFHEKSAQNDGRKNKVKSFFQKVNASYLQKRLPLRLKKSQKKRK